MNISQALASFWVNTITHLYIAIPFWLQKPIRLTLPHCAEEPQDLKMLSKKKDSEWDDEQLLLSTSKDNHVDGVITAELNHFTLYGVGVQQASVGNAPPAVS